MVSGLHPNDQQKSFFPSVSCWSVIGHSKNGEFEIILEEWSSELKGIFNCLQRKINSLDIERDRESQPMADGSEEMGSEVGEALLHECWDLWTVWFFWWAYWWQPFVINYCWAELSSNNFEQRSLLRSIRDNRKIRKLSFKVGIS